MPDSTGNPDRARARVFFVEVEGSDEVMQQALTTLLAVAGGRPLGALPAMSPAPAALPAGKAPVDAPVEAPEEVSLPANYRRIPRPKPDKTLGTGHSGTRARFSDEELLDKARQSLRPGESASPAKIYGGNYALGRRAMDLCAASGEFHIDGDKRKTLTRLASKATAQAPAAAPVGGEVAPAVLGYPAIKIDPNDESSLRTTTGEQATSWDDLRVNDRAAIERIAMAMVEKAAPQIDDQADLQSLFSIAFIRRQVRDMVVKDTRFRLIMGGQTAERVSEV